MKSWVKDEQEGFGKESRDDVLLTMMLHLKGRTREGIVMMFIFFFCLFCFFFLFVRAV
jgi:hypothetical protein